MPAVVDLLDVDGVLHVHELQEMEQEQRHVGVCARGHIRHGRGPGNARIDLTEIYLVGVEVDQDVDLEEAAVAFLRQAITHLAHVADRSGPVVFRKRFREQVVSAPTALVRGEFRVAGEVGHERSDDGAVTGDARLHGGGLVVDPLHHLQLLADDVLGVVVPVLLGLDEEGGLARVAVGCLHH